MWICIAPCHEHTSKALRWARILKESQFYLHTPRSSANGMNHTCLCLLSQSWYSFTDPGGIKGWVGLVVYTRNRSRVWHNGHLQYNQQKTVVVSKELWMLKCVDTIAEKDKRQDTIRYIIQQEMKKLKITREDTKRRSSRMEIRWTGRDWSIFEYMAAQGTERGKFIS